MIIYISSGSLDALRRLDIRFCCLPSISSLVGLYIPGLPLNFLLEFTLDIHTLE